MKQVQRFKCDFCGKITVRLDTMERHEAECVHNPNSVNCFFCELACTDDFEQYNEYDDSIITIRNVPICVYKDEVITHNDAPSCKEFIKSDKLNFERSYEDAYENYYGGAVKDE